MSERVSEAEVVGLVVAFAFGVFEADHDAGFGFEGVDQARADHGIAGIAVTAVGRLRIQAADPAEQRGSPTPVDPKTGIQVEVAVMLIQVIAPGVTAHVQRRVAGQRRVIGPAAAGIRGQHVAVAEGQVVAVVDLQGIERLLAAEAFPVGDVVRDKVLTLPGVADLVALSVICQHC